MILNDAQIRALSQGETPMIHPFEEAAERPGIISYGVTSFGYDMRLADEWVMVSMTHNADPKNPQFTHPMERYAYVDLYPGHFILCRSVEYFHIPDDVLGIVVGKSTYARCGLVVNCTPLEPGWHGHLTIELHNCSKSFVRVYANEGIAQVVFHQGLRPEVTYADKKGKYQGQTGVTLPKVR